ncbi:hypothetical protein P43SY_001826 [Pythium insidiosum]|uniref:JmjC domain-containing protein n=1 Tax=Pythium insidiosum TaxID=114742 RepID=A0AAD5LHP1_PYTIN|nr:hypothetical protein P43SY_001826 [Pythium insidiosum]
MEDSIRQLCEDAADFWQPLQCVQRVDARELSALEFHRRFVSKNVPVILTNAMTSPEWQHVLRSWPQDEHLIERAGETTNVTVDITPFGFGDAVLELDDGRAIFVMPEEREMPLRQFLEQLRDPSFDGVPYLSHQNDSLRDEFPELYREVPPCIDLAREAFGNEPDAVNIWIGDERAVSTMHKDHYENMYCVVKGRKHFTLLPPAAVACLYETEYPSARYSHDSTAGTFCPELTAAFQRQHPSLAAWRIAPSEATGMTPWIPVDPLRIDTARFPRAAHLRPLECVIETGEVLYLPAMWYHRATQLCETISVNYWHDMEFDCRYVYYNFVHSVTKRLPADTDTSVTI